MPSLLAHPPTIKLWSVHARSRGHPARSREFEVGKKERDGGKDSVRSGDSGEAAAESAGG